MPLATVMPVPTVAPLTGATTGVVQLQAGQVIEAVLAALAADGNAVLAVKGQLLQVLLEAGADGQKLPPAGATITVQVTPHQKSPAQGAAALPVFRFVSLDRSTAVRPGDTTQAAAPPLPDAAASAPSRPSPQDAAAAALRTALGLAAGEQNSLAPLFADLEAALAQPLPGHLRADLAQLFAFRLSPEEPELDQALARAFAAAGLPVDARAAGSAAGTDAADLKRLLLQVKGFLDQFEAGDAAPALAGRAAPRPPMREAPPQGQPPAPPSLDADAPLPQVIGTLKQEAGAALARMALAQFASRDEPGQHIDPARPAERQWVVELPVAMSGGTGVAQFHVVEEREARGGSAETERLWKVRFSLETAEEGSVQAQISCRKGVVSVYLGSTQPATAARFEQELPDLVAMLQGAGLTLGSVQCHPVIREQPAASPGLFLNRAT